MSCARKYSEAAAAAKPPSWKWTAGTDTREIFATLRQSAASIDSGCDEKPFGT